MRIILAVAASVLVTLSTLCVPETSAAQGYGPGGSWQTSCRYGRTNGNVFSAECTNTSGQFVRSSINMANCPGGLVGNNNGVLFCEGGGGGYGNLPGGSWRRSCNNARMNGDTVYASCDTGHGYNQTAFHMRHCPGWALGNNNGNLFCESGNSGYNGGFPGGSWQNGCRNAQMHGNVLSASCSDTSGGYRYSSISMSTCPSRAVGNNNGILFCERW